MLGIERTCSKVAESASHTMYQLCLILCFRSQCEGLAHPVCSEERLRRFTIAANVLLAERRSERSMAQRIVRCAELLEMFKFDDAHHVHPLGKELSV